MQASDLNTRVISEARLRYFRHHFTDGNTKELMTDGVLLPCGHTISEDTVRALGGQTAEIIKDRVDGHYEECVRLVEPITCPIDNQPVNKYYMNWSMRSSSKEFDCMFEDMSWMRYDPKVNRTRQELENRETPPDSGDEKWVMLSTASLADSTASVKDIVEEQALEVSQEIEPPPYIEMESFTACTAAPLPDPVPVANAAPQPIIAQPAPAPIVAPAPVAVPAVARRKPLAPFAERFLAVVSQAFGALATISYLYYATEVNTYKPSVLGRMFGAQTTTDTSLRDGRVWIAFVTAGVSMLCTAVSMIALACARRR